MLKAPKTGAGRFPAFALLAALAGCAGVVDYGFGLPPTRIDYSYAFQIQQFGRTAMGSCNALTNAPVGQNAGTERMMACHTTVGGARVNCGFFSAPAADFQPGRTSADARIGQACSEALYLAYFGPDEEEDEEDDGGYGGGY